MEKRVKLASIKVGERHRVDLGDIAGLAASIKGRGLLHAPVVTTDLTLICGYRRLEAARRLEWVEIDVRIVDIDAAILAERDENEVRKDFTDSERVAIGRAIEIDVGERRGKPSGQSNSDVVIRKKINELPKGQRTDEFAALAAGFDNHVTYRQASKVVDKGVPALVEAMDAKRVSISAASVVAGLPKPEQIAVVEAGPKAIVAKAKEVKAQIREKVLQKEEPKNPLKRAIDEIFMLLPSVEAKVDGPAPGWGGIEEVIRDIPIKQREPTRQQILYLIERLQGWADLIEEMTP